MWPISIVHTNDYLLFLMHFEHTFWLFTSWFSYTRQVAVLVPSRKVVTFALTYQLKQLLSLPEVSQLGVTVVVAL